MSLESIVNVKLLSNPINWVIVVLMVAVFAMALSVLFPPQPATES